MKNIILLFLLSLTFCSCLKNIDDVELNTNPFDANYAFPFATVKDIRIIDTTLASGINPCIVYVDFKVNAASLERVRNITGIPDENVKFVLRHRNIVNPSAGNPTEVKNIDLDDLEADKIYSAQTAYFLVTCGDEICFEFLYEDQVTGSPGGTQTNTKASAIQEIDCFIITP